jgi:3-mercaptopyruvate sulfurtransferase SseA
VLLARQDVVPVGCGVLAAGDGANGVLRFRHVPGAINVPQADLASGLDELLRDRPLLAICRGGSRSLRAAQFLQQAGFDQVVSVKGGTEAWRAAGNRLALGDTSGVEEPRIAESGWAHAGAS